ncbi:MAG: alpha/beta hydrolase [Bacteroidota bacterium]|nr:alpha/beta hydrolase [Bacteroidota bacterium]
MKKFVIIGIAFLALIHNVFGQAAYPFEVKISGKGEKAIIFIPGFACAGDVWTETRTAYEKDFTCYTLTMAGFAGTPPQIHPTFVGWEKGIAQYITDQKINMPVVIGHSMGGGLAMALAADYPELISKIVVVDALPCLAALFNPSFESNPANDCTPVVKQMTAMTEAQFLAMQKSTMPQLMTDTSKVDLVISWSVKTDRTTFAEMYCDFSNTDLRAKIAYIKCPVMVLLESPFVNYKSAIEEQYKNCKTADLRYATKGLHFVMYDDKEWYMKQVSGFIKP